MNTDTRPRRSLVWPLILIVLGLVFLLSNFGVISGVSWLAVASLWPLFLILIGLDIAFARRWPLPTLAAQVAVIAAGIALLAYSPNLSPGFAFGSGNGPGETDITVPRGEATELALTLNAGGRAYDVSGGATALVEAHSANPDLRVRTSGTTRASVRLDQASQAGFMHTAANSGDIQVRVANDIPTSLTINVGAGEFNVDLSNVRITDARVNVGASSMQFVLPKPSGSVDVRLNGGASSITVVVPDGVEARIATTGGFLSLRADNTRLGTGGSIGGCVACGTSVETSGYGAARDRVTVTISAGMSSIVVR